MEIKVYTNEGCKYCQDIKAQMDEANISFIEMPVKDNQQDWQKIMRLTGLGTFPTIVIDNEHYIPGRDFNNPEQMVNFLKNYKPEVDSFSTDIKLLESFKTMAFSINQGMNRIMHQLNELKKEKDEHKSTD